MHVSLLAKANKVLRHAAACRNISEPAKHFVASPGPRALAASFRTAAQSTGLLGRTASFQAEVETNGGLGLRSAAKERRRTELHQSAKSDAAN